MITFLLVSKRGPWQELKIWLRPSPGASELNVCNLLAPKNLHVPEVIAHSVSPGMQGSADISRLFPALNMLRINSQQPGGLR